MNRLDYLNRINTFLARFTQEVKQFNGSGQYDINVHAENVLIPLLREVYEYSGLQNANVKVKNAPAIDLIDYESSVLIQVTATSSAEKITDTIEKFTKNNQYKPFERLIIYIITERQDSYRKDFNALLPEGYDFDPSRDIIDNIGLYKHIKEQILNTQKIAKIERLLSDEFSEIKIETRQATYVHDSHGTVKYDILIPNLIAISKLPKLYIADLQFDFAEYRKQLVESIKEAKKFFRLKHLTQKEDLKYFFSKSDMYFSDYILYEDKILTFRNLHDKNEPLQKVVDIGTITPLSFDEFINDDLDRENVFRSILSSTLTENLRKRDIEWVHSEKVYRFRMSGAIPKGKKVKWKSEAGKGVIFEVLSRDDKTMVKDDDGNERIVKGKHIVCFRHLAFGASFHYFGGRWFLSIKPDWSFTSPSDGHRTSPFADIYTTKLKQIEKNDAVLQNFQFLEGYLISIAKGDMLTPGFTLQFEHINKLLESQPSVPDDVWSQSEPKSKLDKNQLNIDFPS